MTSRSKRRFPTEQNSSPCTSRSDDNVIPGRPERRTRNPEVINFEILRCAIAHHSCVFDAPGMTRRRNDPRRVLHPGADRTQRRRKTVTLTVANSGAPAIQVGSHYHILRPIGAKSTQTRRGMRLEYRRRHRGRFEPGQTRDGNSWPRASGVVYGFGGDVMGSCDFRDTMVPRPPP